MVLQAVDYFLNRSHDSMHQQAKPDCVACSLNQLYDAYWQAEAGDSEAFQFALDSVALDFYHRVCRARGWAAGPGEFHQQHDAADFMARIIDWVREDYQGMRFERSRP